MKKKFVMGSMVVLLLSTLVGCTCEHKYDNGVITKEATCTEEGQKTYTCTLCKDTKIENIPVKKHSYKETITKEATVKEEGEKTFKCEYCGDTYTEAIPVIEDPIGSRTNPYKFTDTIHLDYVEDMYEHYSGGVILKFSHYDKSNYVFKVNIELEDINSSESVEPFYDLILGDYVSSDFVELSCIGDTIDKSEKDDMLYTSLSLCAGGKGQTYLFPIEDKLSDKPSYIKLSYVNAEGDYVSTWVKLP